MIANVMKTNNGKRLIAAMAILMMVVCALIAFTPATDAAEDTEPAEPTGAATELPAAQDGVITLVEDVTLTEDQTVTYPIVVGTNTLTISAVVTVDISFTESLEHVFTIGNGGQIIIDNGTLTVDVDNASSYEVDTSAGNLIFYKTSSSSYSTEADIYLKSGALTVTEAAGVSGQLANSRLYLQVDAGTATFNSNGIGPAYIVQNGGTIDFNLKDGSISAYVKMAGGTMSVSGTNTTGSDLNPEKNIFTPYAMSIASGAVLNVEGKMSVYSGSNVDSSLPSGHGLTIKTVSNNGTINIMDSGSIDVPAGATFSGTGTVNNANSDAIVEQTISEAADVPGAISNNMVDSIKYTGETAPTITNLNKPLTITNANAIPSTGSVVSGGAIIIDPTDGALSSVTTTITFTKGQSTVGTVMLNSFTADSIEFYYGSAGVYVINGSGDIQITGDGKIHGSVAAGETVTLKKDTAPSNVTVNADGTITLGEGSTLIIDTGVTLNAGSNIVLAKGADNATISVIGTFAYSSLPAGIELVREEGGVIKVEGGQGTENIISVSQSVNGTYYLTANTTILEGVTLTVPRNAVLDLMGYSLTVEGTLVVENRGIVTSSVNNDNGGSAGYIVLTTTGSIQNEGTIGDKMTINIANGESYVEGQGYSQVVSMQGVTGVSFELVRTIQGTGDNAKRVYDMAVSGDVSAVRGVENPELTLKNVDINKSMTVGRDITLKIDGITDVTGNGTVFTFDGELMTITGNGFTLYDNGTSAVINGHVIGKINAKVGVMNDQGVLIDSVNEPAASVTFKDNNGFYMVGMTISVQKVTVPQDEGDAKIFQRMFVNGELKITNDDKKDNPAGMIDFGGNVYITETLAIPDDTAVGGNYKLMVSEGGVVTAIADKDPALRYNGAMYEVDGEKTTDPSTFYYTTFAGAMENIATALDGIVYVNGAFTISGTYTIADNQEIDIQNKDTIADKVIVGEGSAITVELGGIMADDAIYQILGKVIVAEGDGYAPEDENADGTYVYAVKTQDSETYDVTYSGFKTAMDEAQAGQTITVVGNAEYDGDLVIPNGVTVQVNEDLTLTVTGDVTIENGGKLVLDASTLAVGEIVDGVASENTVTVAGELDASENGKIVAVSNTDKTVYSDVDVYSTGKLTSMTAVGDDNVIMNAAYYQDGEYVYTSLANAVAYAEENALPYAVHVTGVFTETGAVESDGVDIEVDSLANVTLGDLRLNDAKIALADNADKTKTWYTATVTALNGAGDAAVDATVAVIKTTATVESKVTLNAEGTSQYALQIDNLAGANVQAGTVTFVGNSITVSKDAGLTVSSGTTLLIGENATLVDNEGMMVNNGTISIAEKKTLSVEGTLAGNVNVPKDAALEAKDGIIITGTVTVDADGKFTVTGALQVGASPELLTDTASGAIVGKVTIGATASDYVLAFAGADLSQADIVNASYTELKSTAYQINGIDFATVYTFGNVNLNTVNDDVQKLKDLNTDGSDGKYAGISWYADGQVVSFDRTPEVNNNVGEYAQVTTEIRYNTVDVTVSEGPQITISIDGVVWNGVNPLKLTIGTHTVSAVVNPGYTGEITITFNGVAVTNGQFEITSDMMDSLDQIVLSATGNVTQDSTTVITGGDNGSGDMGLTDYLLIILVILIVIMAIIVALRLMRS